MFPKYTNPYIWFDSLQDGIAISELTLVQFDFLTTSVLYSLLTVILASVARVRGVTSESS
jgi:hypothetical protein